MLDPNWKINMREGGGLTRYREGMSLLYQSGVLEVLESIGRPRIPGTGKDVQEMATQAARSAGFYEALTCLQNFRELFLDPPEVEQPKAEFGGIDALLRSGGITKDEADAVRSGRNPDYTPFLKPAS